MPTERRTQKQHTETMCRRCFLQTAAWTAGTAATGIIPSVGRPASVPPRARRSNVLFIAMDDMSTRVSAFADPSVKTPHMEALAKRGVAVDRAYCQFPLCNPSRASVMTGLRPETLGVLSNEVHWRGRVPQAVGLAQHFADHGYETAAVGKILHAAKQPGDRGAGWTRVIPTPGPSDGQWGRGRELDGMLRDAARAGRKAPPMAQYYQWGPSGLDGEDMIDGRFAAAARRFLGESHAKPFFLAVGFHNPHLPFTAPDRFFDMYPAASVPVPDVPRDRMQERPPFLRGVMPENLAGREITPELTRTLNRAYRACCSHVDACIGQVLDALKKNDLEKNTIVVLWSDHSFLLGEHGAWGKNCLFEEACRVPLIITVPEENYAHGRRCDALAELVDLYPTLTELCGLPTSDTLEGTSLVPLLRDPTCPGKHAAFSTAKRDDLMGRSIRTRNWRYTEYTDGSVELYDCRRPTSQSVNLVRKGEHRNTINQVKALLHAGPKRK